jgi:hypothetical protein
MTQYAVVNITTFTDADYIQSFRQQLPDSSYYDFVGCKMRMFVRKRAEDTLAELELESKVGGYDASASGIFMYDPGGTGQPAGGLYEWTVLILRADLEQIPEGDYEQSLIVERPTGIFNDLWRGTLTNTVGPTR